MKLGRRKNYCHKDIHCKNVKDKLSKEVSNETCQDIEEFLCPKFNAQRNHVQDRRKWRIVQDGHGRWREINIHAKQPAKYNTSKKSTPKCAMSDASNTLSLPNSVMNTVRKTLKTQGEKSLQDSNYQTLSTNIRANIFPGVGKHSWLSESKNVYTESVLKLGDRGVHELQDKFYGINRDAIGKWNEARVHHERMKKAWDVYLESLAKTGMVTKSRVRIKPNIANIKMQEFVEPEKMEKSVKENNYHVKIEKQHEINDQQTHGQETLVQVIPVQQTVFKRNDDFWDFYEQPFVQSH